MQCKACGHENKETAKFCEKCGGKLGKLVCPKCGQENNAGAQFCHECGEGLSTTVGTTPTKASLPVKKGLSSGAIIFLAVAGVLLLAGGTLFLFRDALGINLFGTTGNNADAQSNSSPQVARISYSTNPAPITEVGKPVEFVYDWNAATLELVQEFIDNADHQVLVNGELVTAKVSFSEVVQDALSGGYKTQVAANVGQLPAGKSAVDTTVSFKKPISNGNESYGPGTDKEHIQKHGKVIVNDPADPQASSVDHCVDNCPQPEDITTAGLLWDGETPVLVIANKQGWEPYQESAGNPAVFTASSYPWAHPVCKVLAEDTTLMGCEGEYDQPAPNKDEIGIYFPYPWSASKTGWCTFEDYNLQQAEMPCPTEEDIIPGEVYWEGGVALIDIENPAGWEPYQEHPDISSFLAVNDEHYTDLSCEVNAEDNTMMTCGGPGTIKTGGMAMFLNFPFNGTFCQLAYNEIGIKDICNEGYKFCVYAGTCCPESYTCDVQGCHQGNQCDGEYGNCN